MMVDFYRYFYAWSVYAVISKGIIEIMLNKLIN